MKKETLNKYLEVINHLGVDFIESFNNGETTVQLPGEEAEYKILNNEYHEADLFCRDKKSNEPWVKYEKYLLIQERKRRNAEILAKHEAFKASLFNKAKINYNFNDDQLNIIFNKAYEDYHSEGYNSVAEGFDELIDFIVSLKKEEKVEAAE